jgi:hypothetical protein
MIVANLFVNRFDACFFRRLSNRDFMLFHLVRRLGDHNIVLGDKFS